MKVISIENGVVIRFEGTELGAYRTGGFDWGNGAELTLTVPQSALITRQAVLNKNSVEIARDAAGLFQICKAASKLQIIAYNDTGSDIEKLALYSQLIRSNQGTWSGGQYNENNMREAAMREAASEMLTDLVREMWAKERA